MPEHREGTPSALSDLESFLWWDFNAETWAVWAKNRGFDGQAAQDGFVAAMQVQSLLRLLEDANNGAVVEGEGLARLNQIMRRHPLIPQLSPAADIELQSASPDNPTGLILKLFAEAMISGAWRRFKVCRDRSCRASYFDASKNNTKTWCSMETCGSRNKMRRLRARAAEAG